MDEVAVDRLRVAFGKDAVMYDAKLVDRPDDMAAAVANCEVFIVRNRTQVEASKPTGVLRRSQGKSCES